MSSLSEHDRVRADFARHVFHLIRGRPGQNDRPAMPAGHPVSWGAITNGTVLDRSQYPFPVFIS